TWSPDGKQIAFAAWNQSSRDIMVINTDGSGLKDLSNTTGLEELFPSWSPDGSKIIYEAFPQNSSHFQLFIMNADGTGQTQLLNDPDNDMTPDFGSLPCFAAHMNGAQEFPPHSTPATGLGTFKLDPVTHILSFDFSFSDLVAPETAAHIHGPAP